MKIDELLDAGESYTVHSRFLAPSPKRLGLVGVGGVDPLFTSLPSDAPTKIRDLALEWTAQAETDYDKVMAIQDT